MDVKKVMDAYLNAKSNTVTIYDRYASDKASGNRGRYTREAYDAKKVELEAEGWRVHEVKWESAVARAEKRDAAKPKHFTIEQIQAIIEANPKATKKQLVELLSA